MQLLGYKYRCDRNITGFIILLTDGQENRGTYLLPRAINMVACTNVVVDVISFGRKADKNLPILAQRTGGKHYFSTAGTRNSDLLDILSVMVRNRVPPGKKPIDVNCCFNIRIRMSPDISNEFSLRL